MNFSWSQAHLDFYEKARRFAKDRLEPAPTSMGERPFPTEAWRACSEFGLPGLSIPTAHGGMGLDPLHTARILEAFAREHNDLGFLFGVSAHLLACAMPIVEVGSESLQAEILPKLASGAWLAANAITEEDAGSDVLAMKTTAEKQPDGSYILNGRKSYVTNGPISDVLVTYAVTNPKAGFLGISGFVIDAEAPGVAREASFPKAGLNSAKACQIIFENCRVPASRLLGKEGQGAHIFRQSMQWERACLFAIYVGMMLRQLDLCVGHVRERAQFGKRLSKHQVIAHRLVDMRSRLEQARLLLYQACWKLGQGENAIMDVSMAKVAVSEAAVQSSMEAIQLFGSLGINPETGIEHMLRDALPAKIFSGTSEIQRDLVAREMRLL